VFIDVPGLLDGQLSFDEWSSKFMNGLNSMSIRLVLIVVSAQDRCDAGASFMCASVKAFLE
jgi:GTPase Era involved in 16S rRNA processing